MNKVLIMMMAVLISVPPALADEIVTKKKATWTVAQNNDDFFDDELGDEGEGDLDIEPPPAPPANADEEIEPPKPNRFRNRRSRFNRNKNRNRNRNRSGGGSSRNSGPTTPVEDIKVKKVADNKKKKKKITFASAEPEDITDENFPDIIESFDYPNANIMDVANAIGKLTKKNFIMEPGVNGKITIVAPTPVTVATAWKMFLSALAMNNYTIVPTGDGYLKIRKESNAKNDSIETYSGAYYPTSYQLITRIVQLKYI